jgi:hypothetical protein
VHPSFEGCTAASYWQIYLRPAIGEHQEGTVHRQLLVMTIAVIALSAAAALAEDKYAPGPISQAAWAALPADAKRLTQKAVDDYPDLCRIDLTPPLQDVTGNLMRSGMIDRGQARQRAWEAGRYIAESFCPEKTRMSRPQ